MEKVSVSFLTLHFSHKNTSFLSKSKLNFSKIYKNPDFGSINSRAMALANMELCTSSNNNCNVDRRTWSAIPSSN